MYCILLYYCYLCTIKQHRSVHIHLIPIIMAVNPENIKSQMRKGFVEYAVLLILNRQAAYSSEIITKLKEGQFIIVEGTLYPLLTRLKKAELLNYNWKESTQGPPRKYYEITETGQNFLEELETNWIEIKSIINYLKNKEV